MKRSAAQARMNSEDVLVPVGSCPQWSRRTEILASQMNLVSISEDSSSMSLMGYKSSMGSLASSSDVSSSSSRGSLSGWGSSQSRKSYKIDLSSLAREDDSACNDLKNTKKQEQQPGLSSRAFFVTSSKEHHQDGDSWGFFVNDL